MWNIEKRKQKYMKIKGGSQKGNIVVHVFAWKCHNETHYLMCIN
jgi:hypothetical protein